MSAKILHLDIENMYLEGAVWGLWKQNIPIDFITAEWYVLCYAAKWDKSDTFLYDSLFRYRDVFKKDRENDYNVLLTLRDLLDEADIVVGHNAKAFDVRKINARFLKHGIPIPSPYKVVDTYLVAKKNFNLPSYKLSYLARVLGIEDKLDTDIDLWHGCKRGDKEAWDKMVEYNIQDVNVLEQVYHKLLPWIDNHPNLALYSTDATPVCPKCGSKHLQWRGYYATNANTYRRFQCQGCGGWGRERYTALTKEKRKGVLTNAAL